MTTLRRILSTLLPVLLLLLLSAGTAEAQKGQKTQKVEKPRPVPALPSTVKDILQKYEGKATSLGELKHVAGDYFVVEKEGVATMYPIGVIHSLHAVKDEESGTEVLEIHLIAKD